VPADPVHERLVEEQVAVMAPEVNGDPAQREQDEHDAEAADEARLEALLAARLPDLAQGDHVRVDRERGHQGEDDEEDAHRPAHVGGRGRRIGRMAEAGTRRERYDGEQHEQREEDAGEAQAPSVTLGDRLHESGT
jgi:hypothetical protein